MESGCGIASSPSSAVNNGGGQNTDTTEGMEMVLIEDGGAIASRVKSTSLRLALHAADPTIAGCTAFFGLGTVVLPLLAGLGCRSHDPGSKSDNYSYNAHCGVSSSGLYNDGELKERFGHVDIEFKMKELELDAERLDVHIRNTPRSILKQEVRGIRRWREGAKAALKILQRRSAMAFLGLAPSASEAEVSKVYKRLALELHPDKGGDPSKFQVLQEMRQRTVETDKSNTDQEEEDEKDMDVDIDAEGKHDVGVLRWEAHRSVMQLWDTVQTTVEEIRSVICCLESNSQEVLHVLRMFLVSFVQAEQTRIGDGSSTLEDRFREMTKTGSEIIGVAALFDPEATHSALVTHLGHLFTVSACTPADHQEYSALLEAVLQVKPRVRNVLTAFEIMSAQNRKLDTESQVAQDREATGSEEQMETSVNDETSRSDNKEQAENKSSSTSSDEKPVNDEATDVHNKEQAENNSSNTSSQEKSACTQNEAAEAPMGSSSDEPQEVAKVDSRLADNTPHSSIRVSEQPDNESMLTFAPPPFQLGCFQMQLRMLDRGSWEELRVELLENGEKVGSLHGAYVLRGLGQFRETCNEISEHVGSQVAPLFEDSGRPVPSWRSLLATKSWAGGVVFLEQLVVEKSSVHSAGVDMIRAVLKCLSGPMKRVTLAICVDAALQGSPLKQLCSKMDFQPMSRNHQCTFWEVGKRPNTAPPRADRKNTSKRKQPVGAKGMENVAPEQPKVKSSKVHQPQKPVEAAKPDIVPICQVPSTDWDKLTPRNRHAMATAAATGASLLMADADRFINGKPGGKYWGSDSFPPNLRSNVFKAFVKGFADVVSVISTLLRYQKVPNVDTITGIISPSAGSLGAEVGLHLNKHFISHFIGAGGTVQSALSAVIKEASLFYSTVDSGNTSLPEQDSAHGVYHALPMHMLDGDFEYVRSILDPAAAK